MSNFIIRNILLLLGSLALFGLSGLSVGVVVFLVSTFVWYYLSFIFMLLAFSVISIFVSLVFLMAILNGSISDS